MYRFLGAADEGTSDGVCNLCDSSQLRSACATWLKPAAKAVRGVGFEFSASPVGKDTSVIGNIGG